jgi:flagellar biosynthesis protein
MNEDKVRRAIGLKYNTDGEDFSSKTAPQVVSKGVGDLAEAIIQAAEEAGVLIHEDPHLNEFLATLEIGQEIPETIYLLIAELIAYSYYLQGKTPAGWPERQA